MTLPISIAQPLWPEGTLPNDGRVHPTLTWYPAPADKATGAAVVVCPGGGYHVLADHEAVPVAEWLNTLGIAGIVLHYRLGPQWRHPAMLDDAAQAVRRVRAEAEHWGLDPKRVGILGFSAGGHLASTLATHSEDGDPTSEDPIARFSSRPDLAILIYPVITLVEPHAHLGSRSNLLGDEADLDLVTALCNETQVTARTPPIFLVHASEDEPVPPENSLLFALACLQAKVPVELHLYEKGYHGFGMGDVSLPLNTWPERCAEWLRGQGFW